MACPHQSGTAKFHPRNHQQYEGQYRPLPGRRCDRGIPGGKKRTGVSDHLFQPGVYLGGDSDKM